MSRTKRTVIDREQSHDSPDTGRHRMDNGTLGTKPTSRALVLGALVVGAFAAAFSVAKLIQYASAPAGMAWIPGGEFPMGPDSALGQPDEKPAHRVRVAGFWMDETDVT